MIRTEREISEVTAMLWKRIAEALLEDSDSILYVTRVDNNQLLYMNKKAKLKSKGSK